MYFHVQNERMGDTEVPVVAGDAEVTVAEM